MRCLPVSLALVLGLCSPAVAQTQPAPAPAPSAIDPARGEAARQTVDYLFPVGTYRRIMAGTVDGLMGPMMDSVKQMPLRELAAIGGLPEAELAKLGEGSLAQMMAILDPAYEQRTQATMRTIMAEMTEVMDTVEPSFRDGLSQAYARRFSATELADMNRFFATPSGRAYAAESMVIFMSPEVMAKMQEMMPVLMQRMPSIMQKVQAAVASLPPPRRPQDLSDADRAKLAKLMGVSPESLRGPKD